MGLDDSVFDCAYDIAENKEDKNASLLSYSY